MHETTRRLLGRGSFLLLAALPTLLMSSWCVFLQTPAWQRWQRETWESRAADAFDLGVKIERVSYPRYDVALLQDATLIDPETGGPVVSIRTIEATKNDRGWVLLAAHAELQAGQAPRLWNLLNQRGLQGVARDAAPVELVVRELTVHGDQSAETLTDVRFSLEPRGDGVEAAGEFRIAGLPTAQAVEWNATRNRQVSPPTTRWTLNTKGTPLPCAALADVWPALRTLGVDAHFDGLAEFHDAPHGASGVIDGRLTAVDLNDLVTGSFPHKLAGVAELMVKAKVDKGRLVELAGAVQCGEGVIGRSLLESLSQVETTRMRLAPRVSQAPDLVNWPFRELAFGFRLDSSGLSVSGQCVRTEAGVVVRDAEGPLLRESPDGPVSPVAIVRALAPHSELQVPASRETWSMLALLPTPRLKPPVEENTTRRPGSPLRLQKDR